MKRILLLMSWCCLSFSSPEIVPVQERAQGQSLVGANLLNDSLYSNPASSSFTRIYAIEGTYLGPKSFAASIIDTKTSGMGGAVGYFQTRSHSEQMFRGAKLGMVAQLSSVLGLGITGKWLWGPDPSGVSLSRKDIDMGLLANFGYLQIGGMVRNVFGGEARLDQQSEYGIGARIGYDQKLFLSVASLTRWGGFSPYQYSVGSEYVSPYYFSVKAGYRYVVDTSDSFWSVGTSLLGPKLAVHYAVEFTGDSGLPTEHILSVTVLL